MTNSSLKTITTTSKLFRINLNDTLKGLVVAVGGAVFTVVQNSIEIGNLKFDWTNIWHIALAAFVAYIGKNFFTNSQTVIKGAEEGQIISIPAAGVTTVTAKANVEHVVGQKDISGK
jgi:hypothetical protein